MSDAALTTGLAFALNELFQLGRDRITRAHLAQAAEHEFAGVRCGIMDQFVNLNGRAGNALRLDCRTLGWRLVPLARQDARIVLCDTGVRHTLAASEYNVRREQCREGVEALRKGQRKIRALRDVRIETLERSRAELDPVVYRRCRHVVTENARVLAAGNALQRGNVEAAGALMYASHASLRDDYEVSCAELDALVEIASGIDGVLGARMMGGGFGGRTINLLREHAVQRLIAAVQEEYPRRCGRRACVFEVRVGDGTCVVR